MPLSVKLSRLDNILSHRDGPARVRARRAWTDSKAVARRAVARLAGRRSPSLKLSRVMPGVTGMVLSSNCKPT